MMCLSCGSSSSPISSDLTHDQAHLSTKLLKKRFHGNRRPPPLDASSSSSSSIPPPPPHHIINANEEQSPGAGASPMHFAFVYGTLKQGFGNHWLMEELMGSRHARYVGGGFTSRKFPLVCGPFQVPFLLHTPTPCGHHVQGEVYEIDEFALSRLDELEGISKGHYERRTIDVRVMDPGSGSDGKDGNLIAGLDGVIVVGAECCDDILGCEALDCDDDAIAQEPRHLDDDNDAMAFKSECRVDLAEEETVDGLAAGTVELCAQAYFASQTYGHRMASCAPHIPCYTDKEASTYVRRKDRPANRTFLEHVHAWMDEARHFHSS